MFRFLMGGNRTLNPRPGMPGKRANAYLAAPCSFHMDLKELENGVDADTHWYYQSKKLPLLRFANQLTRAGKPLTIIDIGEGQV